MSQPDEAAPAASPGEATTPPSSTPEPSGWEREIVERLATSAIVEQRRARRWGIFFKFAFLAYLSALAIPYIPFADLFKDGERHTAVVELNGVIAAGSDASADRIATGLRAAFDDERTAAVIVRINSPGGSPVQAGYINAEIARLREKHPETPLYAVIADICASGGYYVAAAADRIFADRSSIVGSIGVLMNGFGFVDAMDKLGVERRLMTAGEHKGLLDPFSPLRPEEVEHLQTLLDQMHRQFIATVREGRGERLSGSDTLFSGLVWTGEESRELGLVDAFGSTSQVAREVVGVEKIVNFSVQDSLIERLADRLGASFAQGTLRVLGLDRFSTR